MFYGCTSLVTAPALPATTLAGRCYYIMFKGCTKIKISAVKTEEYNTPYRIPVSGEGTTATYALLYMLEATGGTFKGDPSINTTYYTSNRVISEESETLIVYNGEIISGLEAGRTATLKTANSELEHDIYIIPQHTVNIAYGGTKKSANKGQTAILKCANNELEHNIVISAK